MHAEPQDCTNETEIRRLLIEGGQALVTLRIPVILSGFTR